MLTNDKNLTKTKSLTKQSFPKTENVYQSKQTYSKEFFLYTSRSVVLPFNHEAYINGAFKPSHRTLLYTWLLEISPALRLPISSLFTIVQLTDFIINNSDTVHRKFYQLILIASISLITKYYEHRIDIEILVALTRLTYSVEDLLQMEILILQKLDYSLVFLSVGRLLELLIKELKLSANEQAEAFKYAILSCFDVELFYGNQEELVFLCLSLGIGRKVYPPVTNSNLYEMFEKKALLVKQNSLGKWANLKNHIEPLLENLIK